MFFGQLEENNLLLNLLKIDERQATTDVTARVRISDADEKKKYLCNFDAYKTTSNRIKSFSERTHVLFLRCTPDFSLWCKFSRLLDRTNRH